MPSFLKKRSKKLLILALASRPALVLPVRILAEIEDAVTQAEE